VNLAQIYPELRDDWISGIPALPQAPEEWRPVLDVADTAEAERRLIALAGQALEVGFRPAPPADANTRPDLPRLAKPTMPDACRPLFRTVMAQEAVSPVLQLVDAHGFSAHPLDWFPAASTPDIPSTYLPWQDWLRGANTDHLAPTSIDEQTWAYAAPAARLTLLQALRATDPNQARQLIADHAGTEPADTRLRLIDLLHVNLSMADAEYLESLASDRSGKVKSLANGMLSRLGIGADPSDDLAELAGFLQVQTKGLLNRQTIVTPVDVSKNQAQVKRRTELFAQFTLTDLAKALGLTPEQLVDGWQSDQTASSAHADALFATMVANSGTDVCVDKLAIKLLPVYSSAAMTGLMPRVSPPVMMTVLKYVLNYDALTLWLTNLTPNTADSADIMGSKSFQTASKTIAAQRPSLLGIAYVATPTAARTVLNHLTANAGIRPHDPLLAPLRLNAALAESAQNSTKETP